MAKKYVELDNFISTVKATPRCDLATALMIANNYSTADVAEVKHGHWTKVEVIGNGYGQTYYQHKNCTVNSTQLYPCGYECCPRCGAKMDGRRNT